MTQISIQVVHADGLPVSGSRVAVAIQGVDAGVITPMWTNAQGVADFQLPVGAADKITIYVNGHEKVAEDRIRTGYRVVV